MRFSLTMYRDHQNSLENLERVETVEYLDRPSIWLDNIRELTDIRKYDVCRQAMLNFLDNSGNIDAYGKHHWGYQHVMKSWARIKMRTPMLNDYFMAKDIATEWKSIVAR